MVLNFKLSNLDDNVCSLYAIYKSRNRENGSQIKVYHFTIMNPDHKYQYKAHDAH